MCRGADGVQAAWNMAVDGCGECERQGRDSAWSTHGDGVGNVVRITKVRVCVKWMAAVLRKCMIHEVGACCEAVTADGDRWDPTRCGLATGVMGWVRQLGWRLMGSDEIR